MQSRNSRRDQMTTLSANLAALAKSTNNEIFDADYKDGEWMVHAVETQETLEQFLTSATQWVSRVGQDSGEIAGFKFVSWKSCQAVAGQARRSLSVIDFGDVRYVIEANLSIF